MKIKKRLLAGTLATLLTLSTTLTVVAEDFKNVNVAEENPVVMVVEDETEETASVEEPEIKVENLVHENKKDEGSTEPKAEENKAEEDKKDANEDVKEEKHTHSLATEKLLDGTFKKFCTDEGCDYYEIVEADADEKNDCEHTFIYSAIEGEEGYHLVTCEKDVCKYEKKEACTYEEGICIKCSSKEPVVEHHFEYKSNENGTHDVFCIDKGCTFEVETKKCEYGEDGICIYCGYEKAEELVKIEKIFDINGTSITVSGNIPENAEISVKETDLPEDYINNIEDTLEDGYVFSIYEVLDITIYDKDGNEWQPVDHGEIITVTVNNVTADNTITDENGNEFQSEVSEVSVYRISEAETTKLNSSYSENEEVATFDTEHFTLFVIGGVVRDTDDLTVTKSFTVTSTINGKWIYSTKTLLFEGTGAMPTYTSSSYKNSPWYTYASSATNIIFDEGITTIGAYNFYLVYSSIESVHLPSTLIRINNYAFDYCEKLVEVNFPEGLTYIGTSSFDRTNLIEITLPSTLKTLSSYAFYNCNSLTTIYGGEGITSSNVNAFYTSSSITTNWYTDNSYLSGLAWTGSRVFNFIGSNLSWEIGKVNSKDVIAALYSDGADGYILRFTGSGEAKDGFTIPWNSYKSKITSVVFDDYITSIPSFSCSGINITSVKLPAMLNKIGEAAFFSCPITSIEIPDSVTSIGNTAFGSCSSLKEITMPISANYNSSSSTASFDGCTNVQKMHFTKGTNSFASFNMTYTPWYRSKSKLTEVIIDSDITASIPNSFLSGCSSLTTLSIPITCPITYSGAFNSCTKIKNLTLTGKGAGANFTSSSYQYTPWYRSRNSITSLSLDWSGLTSIGDYTFYNCLFMDDYGSNFTIPSNIKSIGAYAFYWALDTTDTLVMGDMTYIGDYAFADNRAKEKIVIKSASNIGSHAFYISTPVKDTAVLSYADNPFNTHSTVSSYNWAGDNRTAVAGKWNIGNSSGTHSSVRLNAGEQGDSNVIAKLINLGEDKYKLLISGSGSVAGINGGAWWQTSYVKEAEISGSITNISTSLFSQTYITEISIPSSVTSIGADAFSNCSKLTSITIPGNVTTIGNTAFYLCTNLTEITIPDSVTSIGSYAFYVPTLTLTTLNTTNSVARSYDWATNNRKIPAPNTFTVTVPLSLELTKHPTITGKYTASYNVSAICDTDKTLRVTASNFTITNSDSDSVTAYTSVSETWTGKIESADSRSEEVYAYPTKAGTYSGTMRFTISLE